MAKRKATHRGTCQNCGRLHKLPAGRLSIHGYTVDWGYFNGTCGGTRSLPLEEDRGLLDETVKLLELEAKLLETAEPRDVTVGPAETSRYVGKRRVDEGGRVDFNDFEAFEKTALECEDKWGRYCGSWQRPIDDEYFIEKYGSLGEQKAKTIREEFAAARQDALRQLRLKAAHYRRHAEFLTELADRVHGKPLKEIKEAA